MTAFLYVISTIASLMISFVLFLMLVRAVLSWFPIDDDSMILRFVFAATEPLIYPVRMLLSRFPSLQEFPIDISFSVTVLILILLRSFL